ncbi:hypothetical protein B6S12_08175 [Helicobacter valdiviensis]|uniref:DUF177 domain-containing protein n=1 Tax=Helicobacter valdiviensis TaxID=1458358 RepID=A0A2W6NJP7_9HELI|nr:hypothetical protein [Helicobacter valdiviensis]PZT47596.1 hypothetical protein B6S12_08175 [Helicobacter valdiviensis]
MLTNSKIPFARALQTLRNEQKIPFCIDFKENSKDVIKLEGFLSSCEYDTRLLKFQARLSGQIELVCDMSGQEYLKDLDENLEFYLSDGIFCCETENFEEIIECENGMIDFLEILRSELEMIRCDFHTKDD